MKDLLTTRNLFLVMVSLSVLHWFAILDIYNMNLVRNDRVDLFLERTENHLRERFLNQGLLEQRIDALEGCIGAKNIRCRKRR